MSVSPKYRLKLPGFLFKTIALILFLTVTDSYSHAQNVQRKKADAKSEDITFKDRWGFKTNAVDWLLTIPNVGVEFDLGHTLRSKRTLNLNLKWNWNTSHSYTPDMNFNLFDTRIEWRQYFRTRQRNGFTQKPGAWTWLNEHVFTTRRRNPRSHRAYYWGIYTNYAKFNMKLGKEGKQGISMGAGISVGYTAPLYGYKHGFLDLEIGGSIGLMFSDYDTYWHDKESDCYPILASKSGLVPYPMVTDIRVGFVYRFMSVSTKYKQSAERRVDIRAAARKAIEDQIYKMRERIDSIDHAVRKQGGTGPDSLLNKEELKQWHLMKKERKAESIRQANEKLRQQVADSLGIQLTDSTPKAQLKQIDKALDLRLNPKKEKKLSQKDSVKLAEKESKKSDKIKTDKKSQKDKKVEKSKKKTKKDKKKKKSDKKETVETDQAYLTDTRQKVHIRKEGRV